MVSVPGMEDLAKLPLATAGHSICVFGKQVLAPSHSVTSAWTKFSGPGTVAFANAANPVTAATFSQSGSYVLRLTASDTLLTAFKRMRDTDVSQLPVVDQNGRAVGILDESDVLVKVHRDPSHFNDPVKNAMTDKLETLSPTAKINDLLEVFDRGRVAIVMDDDKFLGLITRTDLLSYLRLHMPKQ